MHASGTAGAVRFECARGDTAAVASAAGAVIDDGAVTPFWLLHSAEKMAPIANNDAKHFLISICTFHNATA